MSISAYFLELAISIINQIGYLGISIILILDNAGAPIPSEAVLALSGAAAKSGDLNIVFVFILGVVMQTIGSSLAYWVGATGGETVVRKYGKYLFISMHDYQKTQAWFDKNGAKAIFISRITPVVRTYMGFVAGAAKMSFSSFLTQTLIGSLVWTIIWVGFGYWVGEEWRKYYEYLHYLDYIIVAAILFLGWRFVHKKLVQRKTQRQKLEDESK
jgi:membrane protein DedA with SNARE-associated domain